MKIKYHTSFFLILKAGHNGDTLVHDFALTFCMILHDHSAWFCMIFFFWGKNWVLYIILMIFWADHNGVTLMHDFAWFDVTFHLKGKFCKVRFFVIFHSPCQDCTCPLALWLDLWRTGVSWWQSMMLISILYVTLSKFCKVSFFRIFHSPHQDCTRPLAL